MTSVTADQLIFTNVEAEQSPAGRSGFQTLFCTRAGLTEPDVAEIEACLFYAAGADRPEKHVFFTTRTGKAAVARLTALDGQDRFGRGGLYFAHALVFSRPAFARLGDDPFTVFRGFRFLRTPEEARAAGDFATGDIGPASLDLAAAEPPPRRANGLTPGALRGLLRLAARAGRRPFQSLGCYGPPAAMFALLEALFPCIPEPLRIHCSFDTYFVGGTLGQRRCWAVGLPADEGRRANLIGFDLVEGSFLRDGDAPPEGAFERWLDSALAGERATWDLPRRGGPAHALAEWLEDRPADARLLADLGDADFQAILKQNRFALENRLLGALTRQVEATLAARVLPAALAWFERQGRDATRLVDEGLGAERLIEWVSRAYTADRRRPAEEQVRALGPFAESHQAAWLRRIYWRWTGAWRRLAAEVRRLDEEEYERFAAWALATLPLRVEWRFVQSEFGFLAGPCVMFPRGERDDGHGLLAALLGSPEEEGPGAAEARPAGLIGSLFRKPTAAESGAAVRVGAPQLRRLMRLLNARVAPPDGAADSV